MKTPICTFDARTGILCPICENKLKSGHLSKADVEVSMKLAKVAEKIPELNKATLIKAYDVEGDLIMAVYPSDLTAIRRDPSIMEMLRDSLQTGVWLIEAEATDRKFLEDLFYPIRILTVNVVWLPDGSKLTKVIVPRENAGEFPLDIERIKSTAKVVRGIDLIVGFEKD